MPLWNDKNSQKKIEFKERRRNFLLAVADNPLKTQIDTYFGVIGRGLEAINKEFETYEVENPKLNQLLYLKSIQAKIDSSIDSNQYYAILIDQALSESKKNQYKEALDHNKIDTWFEKLKIRFYITTEWVMEDWANRNDLDYLDYNEINPYSPQDCKIAGIDVDVKTTVSIGSYHGLPYYTRNNEVARNEIQVAITSSIPKSDSEFSNHFILGIFDSSKYESINLELSFLSIVSNFKNPCYFHPLQFYFLSSFQFEYIDYDQDVIDYWIKSERIEAIAQSIKDSSGFFKKTLKTNINSFHRDLIPIVEELIRKKSLYLLPHYFADFLIQKIQKKEYININLKDTVFSIYKPNEHQELYIDNLFKLFEILPKVRCKWHPEEGIRDMEIKFIDGHIPTFQAVCSHDPSRQTSIYTYSWKTGQTLIYKSEAICSSPECGGLTHKVKDFKSKKMLTYCKAGCSEFGKQAHKSNNKY